MKRHHQIRALLTLVTLALAATACRGDEKPAAATAEAATAALGTDVAARPDDQVEAGTPKRLAFAHTANVMGELEPCG